MNKAETLKSALKDNVYIKEVYLSIFSILNGLGGIDYTHNSNGIFFNLCSPDNDIIIDKVLVYLSSIKQSHKNHLERLSDRVSTIDIYKDLIKEDKKEPKSETKKTIKKTTTKQVKNPFKEPEYKGVYKRINDSMRKKGGRKQSFAEYDADIDPESNNENAVASANEASDDEDLECAPIDDIAKDMSLETELFGNCSEDD